MVKKDASQALRKEIGRIFTAKMRELGLSLRQVEALSGVSKTAVARIINAESDYYIDNFESVARALGLTPSRVLRQAEEALGVWGSSVGESGEPAREAVSSMPSVGVDPNNPFYVAQTQERLARVLRSDYVPAAKHHTEEN